jgi:hypothetical protein
MSLYGRGIQPKLSFITMKAWIEAFMDSLGNNIPANIPKIKHQVLGFIIDRSFEDLRPVLEICPRLIRRTSGKGRKPGEELEENATKRPVVDTECVWLPA